MEVNVQIVGVTQHFGRTEVLKDMDLSLGSGVFGLLGPNGTGKTTLLRTLATAIEPSAGQLRLLGFDPADPGERRALQRRLGYLPQILGCYPNFTVFEFVEYFALLKEMPSGEVRPAVARAIERVGLGDRARSKLKTLSGGCCGASAWPRRSSTARSSCSSTSPQQAWTPSSASASEP